MEELIGRITAKTGIDEDQAREAVAIILDFLNRDGPQDKVAKVIDSTPGARELLNERAEKKSGGFLGGLMGGMGAMGALNELTQLGLGMGQVQTVTREVVAYSKEQVGEETVDEIIESIPGLSQVV